MQAYVSYEEIPDSAQGAVIAIGSFDGMHRGHQVLFEQARQMAAEKGCPLGLVTFDPHPVKILAPKLAPPTLMARDEKLEAVAALGFDFALLQNFTQDFADMAPSNFVEDVLFGTMKVAGVVVGYDFSYGKKAVGSAQSLQEQLRHHGVPVNIVTPQRLEGLVISSTKIRQFVLEGKMMAAATLLGRPFRLSGPVVKGEQRGRQIGTPTANIAKQQEITPALGVYAVWAHLGTETFPCVINVGLRPTFGGDGITVEAHILDFNTEIYGQTLAVDFVQKIRSERKFGSREDLMDQIQKDIQETKKILVK
jgi:riboflavin kinase/FMN adenylyltransferase